MEVEDKCKQVCCSGILKYLVAGHGVSISFYKHQVIDIEELILHDGG